MSLIRADTDTAEVPTPPLSPEDATSAIHAAENLDELLVAFALGAAFHLRHIQIYARQRGELMGYIKIDNGMLDLKEIRARHFSLEGPSLISKVAAKGELYVGPAPDTGPSAAILTEYEVEGAVDLALVPVVLEGRTFCLALGHDEDRELDEGVEVALSLLAVETGKALTTRYMQQKNEVVIVVSDEEAAQPSPTRLHQDEPSQDEPPQGEPPQDEPLQDEPTGPGLKRLASIPATIETLMDQLEGPDAMAAAETLLEQGPAAMRYLVARFPGHLTVRRTTPPHQLPPVFQCSDVLKALAVLGRPVLEALQPLVAHPEPDQRFFATYLLSELGCLEALPLLTRQYRDPDASVRSIGAFTLHRLREAGQLEGALERYQAQTSSDDARTRKDAVAVLGVLGDPSALSTLLQLLDDPEKTVGEAAHAALVNLTKQDHKRGARRWQAWWEGHRHRSRVDWLIDGLNHKDEQIRASSAAELEVVRGKPFGFRPGMSKRERVAIQRQFREWWSFRQWWRENELE